MPPKHHFKDQWWEEMPEKAHQAAIVMGYDAKTWDDDAKIDYDRKPFHETSLDQRRAAMYLGLNPIDKKLDIWWANTDSETKKQAEVIGWDQHKWDDDWNIRDFPIEHLYWKDLDDKQKEAATYFGYTKCTWDESGDDSDLDFNVPVKTGSSSSSTQSHPEEKKEEDYTAAAQAAADVAVEQVKPQKATSSGSKKAFTKSKKFGGDGGGSFDHGNHPAVAKISVRHDGHAVHQLTATYEGANKICSGSEKGDDNVEMNFKAGEYVNKVTVRHNKYIQCLTFETNTGRTLGPAGGKGWRLLGKDKEGDEETITAPNGYKLAGFSGACGNYIDSLVIHWGPVA